MDMTDALIELSNKPSLDAIANPQVRARAVALAGAVPWPQDVSPKPFQEVGIAYAALAGFRCLIGDSQGLGKTVTAIGCLNLGTRLQRPLTPALVVAPASVLGHWYASLHRFGVGYDVVLIEKGTERPRAPRANTVYVTSWHLLPRIQDYTRGMKLRTMILDESQTAKEPTAQWTKAAMRLSRKVRYVLELSGTPAPNRPSELWTQLWMLDHKTFERKDIFEEVLAKRLSAYMIRRLKTQVLQELPQKVREYRYLDMDDSARLTYRHAQDNIERLVAASLCRKLLVLAEKEYHRNRKKMPAAAAAKKALRRANSHAINPDDVARMAMVKLGHLRRVVGQLKVPLALQYIRENRKRLQRRPLVVFVEHRRVLQELGRQLSREGILWTYISGSTPKRARTRRVAAFEAGKLEVLVCTQAAHTGITLTRASEELFVERWWVPSREEQAEDRIHRIGQARQATIIYLMLSDTIDDYVGELVDRKRETLEAVLGGESVREEAQIANARPPKDLSRIITKRLLRRLDFSQVRINMRMFKHHMKRRKAQRKKRRLRGRRR